MPQYMTETDANVYLIGNFLDHEAWECAEVPERNLALIEATRAIDNLNFRGEKADENQANEFPRGEDTVVPLAIQQACALEAMSLLDGKSTEDEIENLTAVNRGFSSVRTTYDRSSAQEWIANGITSARAWQFLMSFLRDAEEIRISRV
jgi:hypothetical protein